MFDDNKLLLKPFFSSFEYKTVLILPWLLPERPLFQRLAPCATGLYRNVLMIDWSIVSG